MRLLVTMAVVAAVAGFTGCKSPDTRSESQTTRAFPQSDEAPRAAGLADQEIAAARRLYVAKCARCHKFYDPADYRDAQWHSWMAKMSKKARLKAGQEQLLSRYLQAFRAGEMEKETAPLP